MTEDVQLRPIDPPYPRVLVPVAPAGGDQPPVRAESDVEHSVCVTPEPAQQLSVSDPPDIGTAIVARRCDELPVRAEHSSQDTTVVVENAEELAVRSPD